MNQVQKQKIIQAIALLNSALNGGGGQDSPLVPLPPIQNQIKKFVASSKNLQPELQSLTNLLVQAFNLMNSIIAHSGKSKKYTNDVQQNLKNKFMDIGKRVQAVEKNPQFVPHAKAFSQIIGTTFWIFTPSPEFIFKGGIQAADYNAYKFKTKKNMAHNSWYNEVMDSIKKLYEYVKQNYPMGLTFNLNGSSDWSNLSAGAQSAPQVKQHSKSEANKQKPKQQVKKAPSKTYVGINWNIANYQQGQIVLPQNQIKMMNGVFVQNCKNCVVKVQGKFKSILINKCENVGVVVKSCVSGIQIMNCQKMRVQITQKSPSVSIDKSKNVTVILNGQHKQCDIISSKASELKISYTTGNDLANDFPVSEQLITKWNAQNGKFVSKVYDEFL